MVRVMSKSDVEWQDVGARMWRCCTGGELCSDLYHTHILENFLKILVKVSFFVVLNRFWHVYGGKMVPRAC